MALIQEYALAAEHEAINRSVDSLLEEMTLEEKVGQLNQLNGTDQTGPEVENVDLREEIRNDNVGSVLNVDGLENRRQYQKIAVEESRLGIPLLFGYDVVHGYETLFPIPLGEAASWNPKAAETAATVAASEATAAGIHWTFAPPVDVTRDARWGRAMETSGEDPYLGAEFAAARVRGFQGADLKSTDTILACAKHYAAYGDVMAGREYNTVEVSESTLRNIHLPPFEAAVDAGVGTVMNAFTDINGVPAGANKHLVDDLLKDTMGFEGFVVSDWNSFRELIYHCVAADERDAARLAIEAGSDMDMVGHVYVNELAELVEDGVVSEGILDDAVRRILRTKFILGLVEDPYRYFDEQRKDEKILSNNHQEAARDVARESIVLMKNEQSLLPLTTSDEIAVIGALADSSDDVLGNWRARGDPKHAVSVLDGIESTVEQTTDVRYARGYERSGESPMDLQTRAVDVASSAEVAVVVVGEPWNLSGECSSRTSIDLPGDQQALLEHVIETSTPVVAVMMNGRPLAIPWMAENVPAIVETWFLGTQAGNAIADVLFGTYNPSGRLPISFPRSVGQAPIYYNHPPTGRPKTHSEPGWSTSYIDMPNEPLYPFGHGLSYTTFEYSNLELSSTSVRMTDESLRACMTVENVGDVAGEEIVQLYTRDLVGSRTRPVQELKRFRKLKLEPGDRRTVEFELESDDLAFWTRNEKFTAEPGEFRLMVGRSAADVRLTDTFELIE